MFLIQIQCNYGRLFKPTDVDRRAYLRERIFLIIFKHYYVDTSRST